MLASQTLARAGLSTSPVSVAKSFGRPRLMGDMIIYPKRGWEPPPDIEGYERDPNDLWRFKCVWPACKFRHTVQVMRQCGSIDFDTNCQCKQCPLYRTEVKLTDCRSCEFKES